MPNAPLPIRYVPRSWLGCFVGAPLWGVVAGLLIGARIYAPFMTARDATANAPLGPKMRAVHQRAGVTYGVPLGALCGLAAGVTLWRLDRKIRLDADGN